MRHEGHVTSTGESKIMNQFRRFRVNTPRVVHETIDDEVVIIDFDSGSYYSLDKVGTDIWGLIEGGATVSEIVEGVTRRYEGKSAHIEEAIDQLIAELQQENLIVPDDVKKSDSTKAPNTRVEIYPEAKSPDFEAPSLQKYTDMQDLLLLDPIHEVDETGWPNVELDSPDGDE
jgi:hypothetical protein